MASTDSVVVIDEFNDAYYEHLDKVYEKMRQYRKQIEGYCKSGNIIELKKILEDNPELKEITNYTFFCRACDNNHYHIMRYLANYYDYDFNKRDENIFNYNCRRNNLNVIKTIISITIQKKSYIDFNVNEYVEYGAWGEEIGKIANQLKDHKTKSQNIINYLESCGATSYSNKIIL